MSDEQARLDQHQREEREYENARYEQEAEAQYISQMEDEITSLRDRIEELEAKLANTEEESRQAERECENVEARYWQLKRKYEMLAEHAAIMQRKYEALVEGITFAQSHTSETLHLLQWDQLGWDVPEEVIESLGKADSELRALLEGGEG